MKVIIRSGFELVMEREQQYIPDFFLYYQTFSKYYPHQAAKMRQCLYYYLNPISSSPQLNTFIKNWTAHLLEAFKFL